MIATDWAWAAGIFEGEGCSTLRNKRYPSLQLRMKDEEIIRKFANVLSCGHVYYEKNHQTNRMTGATSPMWLWTASNPQAFHQAMWMMWPWLGERRRVRMAEVADNYVPKTRAGVKCRTDCGCGRHRKGARA